MSGAVGGPRGRGGRRRRWQRAGTHAAPRPTWPAALPPPAAAARCPLTSGGECGDRGHRGCPGTTRTPLAGRQKRPPALCMPRQALGDLGRDPCSTQSPPEPRRAPPGAAAGKAIHLRAAHPSPPPSPLLSLAPHHSNAHLHPHSGKQINSPTPDGNKRTLPLLPSVRGVFSWPLPLLTGASGAPPVSPARVCSPIPPGSSWRVLGFHSLRLPQPGQHRRPLPVRVLFSGYGGTMGRGGGQESWAGLPRGPSLVWPGLSAVTTMGSL